MVIEKIKVTRKRIPVLKHCVFLN